jgi:chemotaxis protein CheD
MITVAVATEIAVRMGDCAVATNAGDALVAFGLGSCIGLVLLDRRRLIAAMAHVMLPGPHTPDRRPGTFADSAVPHMIELMLGAGALRPRLEAVIAGGAQMFASAAGLEIGARNDATVRAHLASARVPLLAAATGGQTGRTMRVRMDDEIAVTTKPAGGVEEVLA